jgi:hypothetical protein
LTAPKAVKLGIREYAKARKVMVDFANYSSARSVAIKDSVVQAMSWKLSSGGVEVD